MFQIKCFGRYRLFVSQKRKFPSQMKIDVSLNSSGFAHKPLSRISSIVTVLNSTLACRLILLLYNIIHNHNIYTEMYKTPYWLWSKMYIILQIGIFSFLISSSGLPISTQDSPAIAVVRQMVSDVVGCVFFIRFFCLFLVKYQNNKTHTPTLTRFDPLICQSTRDQACGFWWVCVINLHRCKQTTGSPLQAVRFCEAPVSPSLPYAM